MNESATTSMSALVIFLTCTTALLLYTVLWAAGVRLPVPRAHRPTGASATPYWYSPNGRAEERGLAGPTSGRRAGREGAVRTFSPTTEIPR